MHSWLFNPGVRVLDLACGAGRHAIAAAELGAAVTAVDWSEQRLQLAETRAQDAGVTIEFVQMDLERDPFEFRNFEVVMQFNFLDRQRLPEFLQAIAPGGWFIAETFREQQREFGWGPSSPDHLLQPLELPSLVHPLTVEFSREVVETIDTRSSALASVVARRPAQ